MDLSANKHLEINILITTFSINRFDSHFLMCYFNSEATASKSALFSTPTVNWG